MRVPSGSLEWSPIRASDGAETLRLIRECESKNSSLFSMSEDQLADLLESGGGNSETVVARNRGAIKAVASVEVLAQKGSELQAQVGAYIHPECRTDLVGAAILEWQKKSVRELASTRAGIDTPVVIHTEMDGHMTAQRELLRAAGFEKVRTFDVMYRNLGGEPLEVSRPRGGFAIVPWIAELESQVRELHMRAFKDHWGSASDIALWWDGALRALQKRWSFVAISPEGRVAGYILVGRHPAQWLREGVSTAYAELLGVDPQIRGGGVAKALITKAMRAAQESSVERFGLDVDVENPHGARGFYERLGFESVGDYSIYGLRL